MSRPVVRSRSGVYAIVNTVNGRAYVGSSSNIGKRWSAHRIALRQGVHTASYLQRAWNKYGEAAFEWVILEYCACSDLMAREAHWTDAYRRTTGRCYNTRLITASSRGHTLPPETRAKMSVSKKGKKQTPEHAAHQCAARRGRKNPPDVRLKMGAVNRRHAPELIQRIKEMLKQGGMTNQVIAATCGVSHQYVSKIKHGTVMWVHTSECGGA